MPTADYEISGAHTADHRTLRDRINRFSKTYGERITGMGPGMSGRDFSTGGGGRSAMQASGGSMTTAGRGDFEDVDAYSRLPQDPRAALHYPAPTQVRHRAPGYERRSAILDQPPLIMRLAAAVKAFSEGKVPTNEQLEDMIDAVSQAKKIRGVSSDGVDCLKALDALLQTIRTIVRERNQDEAIQRFFYHLRLATSPVVQQASQGMSSQQMALKEAMSNVSLLAKSLIFNSDPNLKDAMKAMSELFRDFVEAAKEEGVPVESPTEALADVSGRMRGDIKGYIKSAKTYEMGEEGGDKESEEEKEMPLKIRQRGGQPSKTEGMAKKQPMHVRTEVKKPPVTPRPPSKRMESRPSPTSTSSAPPELGHLSSTPAAPQASRRAKVSPKLERADPVKKFKSPTIETKSEAAKVESREGEEETEQPSFEILPGNVVETDVGITAVGIGRESVTLESQTAGEFDIDLRSSTGPAASSSQRTAQRESALTEETAEIPTVEEAVIGVPGVGVFTVTTAEIPVKSEETEQEEAPMPAQKASRLGAARQTEEMEQEDVISVTTTTSTASSAIRSMDEKLKQKLRGAGKLPSQDKPAKKQTGKCGKMLAPWEEKPPVESWGYVEETEEEEEEEAEEEAEEEEEEEAETDEGEGKGFLGKMALVAHKKLLPTKGGPETTEVDLDKVVDRFILVIRRLHDPSLADTRNALAGLLHLASGFDKRGLPWDPHLDVALRELEVLISRFAGGRPLEPLIATGKSLKAKLMHSEDLRILWSDTYDLLYRCFADTNYVMSRDLPGRARNIAHRLRSQISEKGTDMYEHDFRTILREVDGLVDDLTSDRLSMKLGDDLRMMKDALFIDKMTGRPTFKSPLLMDITHVIIPMLWEDLKFIPIPRVEHKSRDWHIVIEDIVLTTENVFPNLMEAKIKNSLLFGLRPEVGTSLDHSFTLNFYQIQADVCDMPFFFKKKTGFPQMTDWGVANFFMGGEGMTIRVKIGLDVESSNRTIYPQKVVVSVENLDLQIVASRSDAIYRMLHSTIVGILRKEIASLIGRQVLEIIAIADERITPMKNNYMKAIKSRARAATQRDMMQTSDRAIKRTSKFVEDVIKSDVAKGWVDKIGGLAKDMMAA
ncbi:hypothetical protein HDU97_000594 [Phlyctochytrium planicorne]|nr:hypothetical protein HDU97_000594 [Phlyctochytrium planicorne]